MEERSEVEANNILSVHTSCNYVLDYLFPITAEVKVVERAATATTSIEGE